MVSEHVAAGTHAARMSPQYEVGLVSVIVPTFNRSRLLLEAVDSVWKQTYRPVELLVVDDGSTDNTREVMDKWRCEHANDANFRVHFFFQENAGAPAARNWGLIESRGEYIQFLDSDDLLLPERLALIVSSFEKSSYDYVYAGFEIFCGTCGEILNRIVPEPTGDPLELFCRGRLWVNTWGFAWRRSMAERVGLWDTSLDVCQDLDYCIRTLLASRQGGALQHTTVRARHGGSFRISDIRQTRRGYDCRLHCETTLVEGIKSGCVSPPARMAVASRLYGVAVAAYPGFPDMGQRFGELAESLGCGPNGPVGARMRKLWRAGRIACFAHQLAVRARVLLRCLIRGRAGLHKHICQKSDPK
jgi:hypothetical protein